LKTWSERSLNYN